MPNSLLGVIASILVALFTGGGLVQLLNARATRRGLETDSLKKVADATIILLDPMRAEIERLEGRVAKLSDAAEEATKNYEQAEQRVRILTAQAQEIAANYKRALDLLQQHNIPFPWDTPEAGVGSGL